LFVGDADVDEHQRALVRVQAEHLRQAERARVEVQYAVQVSRPDRDVPEAAETDHPSLLPTAPSNSSHIAPALTRTPDRAPAPDRPLPAPAAPPASAAVSSAPRRRPRDRSRCCRAPP